MGCFGSVEGLSPCLTQPNAEECADAPLNVVQGEALLVAVIGEVEYHRETEELVAPLAYDSTAPCDDDLGKVVVKGYAGVTESHGRVAIDDERRQGGQVQQPTLA